MSHTIGRLDPATEWALEELGEALRRLRWHQGLSQRVIAERCGLSQSTISRIETGKAPGVRLAWLARIFAGYNRDAGPPGARRWEVETPPYYQLLLERFGETGRLAKRMREAELVRERSLARLMQATGITERRPCAARA